MIVLILLDDVIVVFRVNKCCGFSLVTVLVLFDMIVISEVK